MTGIRDLSLIATPPIRRLPIKTIVCEFDEADIKPAVEFEIKRNGQIFFVVPRIEFLDQVFQFLCKLFPKFRIDQIHGQSPDLEDTVINFYEHEIDILISTNIVDSGIDIPNVNTIFLYRFDLFGIAQLHQLRGRVGRSGLQAFAYFLVPSEREMSQNAQKKLELMQTFDNLGSGFSLANQDMDIRGAGNLLGEEQSGYIKEVGFELYQSMLNEAILMVKAGRDVPFEKLSPQVNLGVSALIPERYISDQDLRLSLYRRMGRLRDDQEIEFFHSEITEKYGTTPIELKNLLVLISTQINCKTLNVNKLEVIATGFVFTFHNNYCKTPEKLLDFLNSNELKEDGWIAKIRNDHAICMIKKWKTLDDRTKNIHSFISHLRLFLESQ
jgi:transcription-repair coupling factor (superfamily II helicase)